jgi:hypothetical protein
MCFRIWLANIAQNVCMLSAFGGRRAASEILWIFDLPSDDAMCDTLYAYLPNMEYILSDI